MCNGARKSPAGRRMTLLKVLMAALAAEYDNRLVPRGKLGMVVARIGLNLGVIGRNIYGIIVFLPATTALIARRS
jgi:hypothetical protein